MFPYRLLSELLLWAYVDFRANGPAVCPVHGIALRNLNDEKREGPKVGQLTLCWNGMISRLPPSRWLEERSLREGAASLRPQR